MKTPSIIPIASLRQCILNGVHLWWLFPSLHKLANKPVVEICECSLKAEQSHLTISWQGFIADNSEGAGRKMTDDMLTEHVVVVAQCLLNGAAAGHRCTVGNCRCALKSPLTWNDLPPMSSLSFQSVITGILSCAFPQRISRTSSMMIRLRLTGCWPCVVLASSTWRGLRRSKASWPN